MNQGVCTQFFAISDFFWFCKDKGKCKLLATGKIASTLILFNEKKNFQYNKGISQYKTIIDDPRTFREEQVAN